MRNSLSRPSSVVRLLLSVSCLLSSCSRSHSAKNCPQPTHPNRVARFLFRVRASRRTKSCQGVKKPPALAGSFLLFDSVSFLCDCGCRARERSRSPGGRYARPVFLGVQYPDLGKRDAVQYVARRPAGRQQIRTVGSFIDFQHEKHLDLAIDLHSFKKHRGVHVAIVMRNISRVNPREPKVQTDLHCFTSRVPRSSLTRTAPPQLWRAPNAPESHPSTAPAPRFCPPSPAEQLPTASSFHSGRSETPPPRTSQRQ